MNASTLTDESEVYSLRPHVIDALKLIGRYSDFVAVFHAIISNRVTNNIAFHLL